MANFLFLVLGGALGFAASALRPSRARGAAPDAPRPESARAGLDPLDEENRRLRAQLRDAAAVLDFVRRRHREATGDDLGEQIDEIAISRYVEASCATAFAAGRRSILSPLEEDVGKISAALDQGHVEGVAGPAGAVARFVQDMISKAPPAAPKVVSI